MLESYGKKKPPRSLAVLDQKGFAKMERGQRKLWAKMDCRNCFLV